MNDRPLDRSPVISWLMKAGTFCGLSVLWLLCCLPVLTIVPACVALYDSVVHCLLREEDHPYKRFFANFWAELLRGMGITLFWLVLVFLFLGGFRFLFGVEQGSSLISVYSMIYAGTMLIPLLALVWLIPLEARFQYGFFGLHKAAFSFSLSFLPISALLVLILAVTVVIIFFMPALLVLVPAVSATVQAALTEKVLRKFHTDGDEPEEA